LAAVGVTIGRPETAEIAKGRLKPSEYTHIPGRRSILQLSGNLTKISPEHLPTISEGRSANISE